jgi:hypothetical protein
LMEYAPMLLGEAMSNVKLVPLQLNHSGVLLGLP